MSESNEVKDMEILRHMLGIGSHIPRSQHGFRNYFNAEPGHNDMPSLERLVERGLVKQNQLRPDYWHATEDGAKVAGLDAKQIAKLESA